MLRIVGALLIAILVVAALRLAIILVLLAGLIFRTKQTVGLLAVLLLMGLFAKYPLICSGLVAILVIVKWIRKAKQRPPPAALTRHQFRPSD